MTDSKTDAGGVSLLALADALAAQLKHTGGPLFLTSRTVTEIIAALRSTPVRCEAERQQMHPTSSDLDAADHHYGSPGPSDRRGALADLTATDKATP